MSADDKCDALECPICGDTYLHHDKIEVFGPQHVVIGKELDNWGDRESGMVTVNGDDRTSDPAEYNGGYSLKISFICEYCGRIPPLIIKQHKGGTYVHFEQP